MKKYTPSPTAIFLLLLFTRCHPDQPADTDWRCYLGSPGSSQYSPLTQINKGNVGQLKVAWTYRSGGADTLYNRSQIQCNPLIINGVLYGTSPRLEVFALDAATGEQKWKFSPGEGGVLAANRGLAWWEEGGERRLLAGLGETLYALDPANGQPISTFGNQGSVNLHTGLGQENALKFVTMTTPGVVYKNLYIIGSRVDEDFGAAPGHIRAFDVRTGELVWMFRTIPMPGEYGHDTWEDPEAWKSTGGANSWAGLSLDEESGVVYVPTGSASYDFYGGNRRGDNLFANCLIALDAGTGERIWHFQTIHHDVWDRDLPAPPNLVTVTRNGRKVEAVAQVTKTGYVFLFDRKTGEPLFPVAERPVPASDLPGEHTAPTQPHPAKPAPYVRQVFTEKDLNPFSPDLAMLRDSFRHIRSREMYDPPGEKPLMIFPGFDGGAEWGGGATDPDGILYVNANEMPWVQKMISTASAGPVHPGGRLYFTYCASCHGYNRGGDPTGAIPSLVNLKDRKKETQADSVLTHGRNRMPSFMQLKDIEREAILAFLFDKKAPESKELEAWTKPPVPYRADGYNRFLDSKKMPAIAPPWGTLSAIDLNTGDFRWQVPLGDWGVNPGKPTGTENYGGPVVTASGLLFIAATRDEMFRVFDTSNGQVLWETQLPAGGYATPAVYAVNGKQYVVIACGGGKMGTKSGDAYLAFTLPE